MSIAGVGLRTVLGAKTASIISGQSGRLPIVVVDDASQDVPPANDAFRSIFWSGNWKVLVDALVRPCLVVIANELTQYTKKVSLVEKENLVHAFLANRPHPALRERIGLGCPKRRANDPGSL